MVRHETNSTPKSAGKREKERKKEKRKEKKKRGEKRRKKCFEKSGSRKHRLHFFPPPCVYFENKIRID